MKIFLIGLPGSGKSTIAKALANELNIPFVDLDLEIEGAYGKSIASIFEEKGEEYFREIESKVLRQVIDDVPEFVMATGGGAPCFHDGMERMNRAGTTIFMDVQVEVIAGRINPQEQTKRPLLEGGKDLITTLQDLRALRLETYRKARFTVSEKEIKVEMLLMLLR